jgi:hypothetical protein
MHRSGRTFLVLLTAIVSVAPQAHAWNASKLKRPAPAPRAPVDKGAAPEVKAPRSPAVRRAPVAAPRRAAPAPPRAAAPVAPTSPKPPARTSNSKPPPASAKPTAAVTAFKAPSVTANAKTPTTVANFKPEADEATSASSKKAPTDKHATSKDSPKSSKPSPPPAPSYFRVAKPPPPSASWAPYYRAPWKRGYVTLFGHGKKWSGYLMGPKGEVPPASRASLSSMLASWRTGKEALIDERLIAMITLASDEFGGRAVRIVSGYREHSYAPDSKHKTGQALDFSIPGVPNEALRDYLRTLDDVGIGFYPNSTHVHLDVREKTTYWVDYSFPGERPHYAWEPGTRKWGARERAIADALDHLPSSITATAAPVALSAGKPAPLFAARPLSNRATLDPAAPDAGAAAQRVPPADGFLRTATPASSVVDGGATTSHSMGDSGFGFWSRAASAVPDGGAPAADAMRSTVR